MRLPVFSKLMPVITLSNPIVKERLCTSPASSAMNDHKTSDVDPPPDSPDVPIEVLGSKKFYTDEFDAFEKYYEKIQSSNDKHSLLHMISLVDQLPFLEFCELSGHVKNEFPKKNEQNEEEPELKSTNDNIEFAHPSLQMMDSPSKGRHLITETKLEKGTVIINEKATVLIVDPLCTCLEGDDKMYRCHHCAYAVSKFYTCANCNIVVYCSMKCLSKSYHEYHRFECEALQRHYWKLNVTDNSYTAFRMMLYGSLHNFKHELPEDNKTKWGNKENNYPYMFRLQTHFNNLPVKRVYEILKETVKTVIYLAVRTNFFNEFNCNDKQQFLKYVGGLLVRHYCQAQINSVLLKYPNFDAGYAFNISGSTGKAICPTVALLNHACSPNAVIIPRNDRILIKTLKPILANSEITIAYQEIDTFLLLEERRLIMEHIFYFESFCECIICDYEENWQDYPYKCQRCQKGKAKKITVNKGKEKLWCKDCKSRSEMDVRAEKTAKIASNLYRVTSGLESILRAVESYDKIYPADSWILLDTYRLLYDQYELWEERPVETMKYGLMYFSILEQYLPRSYLPCLEARLRFFYCMANSDNFTLLRDVTSEEFITIKFFMEDCLRTKNDIRFYIPARYLEAYIIEVLNKLETVQFNLRVVTRLIKHG